MNSNIDIKNSLLVVAHPDDEILWFSSVLQSVSQTLVCYSDLPPEPWMGERRRAVIKDYPLDNVQCLDIMEPLISGTTNAAKQDILQTDPETKVRADKAFNKLLLRLEPYAQNAQTVFTHNPWGEYGHEDHVRLYIVLAHLQKTYGFELYFSAYVSALSFDLMRRETGGRSMAWFSATPPCALCEKIKDLYLKHECWTWSDDPRWQANWKWPEAEYFLRFGSPMEKDTLRPCSLPLLYLDMSGYERC